ncbi:receptor-like protein 12 isoform X3 [Durio zibethinus]|uniref:Receptor-like protein 12 isoform X3 n=1 Tax=Durio zibethinus TaxID=66656 RepID=A0A6P5YVS7_DURZI|nr:receptor-like protein 12 isoform X3 [Durio zibethinus]
MRPSFAFAWFLFLLTLFQFTAFSFSSVQPVLCHDDERLALMQFKESFIIHEHASPASSYAYPKVDDWTFQGVDCCSWDGVECDQITGQVIGLDLSSSLLYGSINSSSSLFHLVHLQKLNLAHNDFNYSVIPSALGNLSMLTYLNLSNSVFSGQIPSEISKLFRLSSLDLSNNWDPNSFQRLLELKIPDLKSLIQNFTDLKHLHLSYVDVASPIPSVLANFSSLTSLHLEHCGLLGKFPLPIFHLPNLQTIWLVHNLGLTGYFPEFNFTSQLKVLALLNTSFSGELAASIGDLYSLEFLGIGLCNFTGLVPSTLGNLPNLQFLDLGRNFFSGLVPSTLGNLTKLYHMDLQKNYFTGELPDSIVNLISLEYFYIRYCKFAGLVPAMLGNLAKLMVLDLGSNLFKGLVPSTLGNLPNLQFLDLGRNCFRGSVPSTLGNLTKIYNMDLQKNNFTGSIPPELTNLTQLTYLNLMENMLEGSVPSSISRLKKLEFFDCDENRLDGIVELDAFLELKHLKYLFLSLNNFYLISRNNTNATSPQLVDIGLRYCHLRGFPDFLRNQHQLQLLDLSSNNIQGQIPKWMSKVSIETLLFLDLSSNSLTGFDEFPVVLPWSKLGYLKLDSNILQGSLPVPPLSTIFYSISNNSITGEIPQLLCNLSSLSILDVSHNNLSGEIPLCLSNFSKYLLVLSVRSNNFHGPIPHSWASGNRLKMIDLGKNKFQGKIPRSLMECGMLQYLDLGNNQISDAFPSWLGTLPELNILILCSNALYGYFERWNTMRSLDVRNSSASYMLEYLDMRINVMHVPRYYIYSMTITNKGREMLYPKIIQTLVAIDLSSNRFDGEIPESIGSLKELHLLNVSNNILVGRIPSAIAKLKNLEALDLSQNKLAGRIPWELSTQLTFLEVLNVSHNNLTGPIPQGQQFDTFQSSSFEGNLGLCGKQLLKECDSSSGALPPPSSSISEDSGFFVGLHWKVVLLGYGSGFLIGVTIGHVVTTRKSDWFAKTFSKISRGRTHRRSSPVLL